MTQELSSSGPELWQRAKELIPGGSMLFSKRAELSHPSLWPSYFAKAKGIKVETLDGAIFRDFSTMSVGTCSLGYGNPAVDSAVHSAIDAGVMSSLNAPEEVELVARLVELHPPMEKGKLLRTGGEANALAIRVARSTTGREKVAFCGYHGWHDWYLSASLENTSGLDGHLMSGLTSDGVPKALRGSATPFSYGDIDTLKQMLETRNYAAVMMEVSRTVYPDAGFLEDVRRLCSQTGTLLIFDECTSGFRETIGGLYLSLGIQPDMVMLGKALGNGYAITALLGTAHAMSGLASTFASSTFWTERLGPTAAIATISEMTRLNSPDKLIATGRAIKSIWTSTFESLEMEFDISGLDPLASFKLRTPDWPILKTLFTQEMLGRGYLATSQFYASTSHDEADISGYRGAFSATWARLSGMTQSDLKDSLVGEVAQSSFSRMN